MYSRLHACPGGRHVLSHKCLSHWEKRPNLYFVAGRPKGPRSSVAGLVLSPKARSVLSEIRAERFEVP